MNVKKERFSSLTKIGVKNNKLNSAVIILILLFSFPLYSFSPSNWGERMSNIQQTGRAVNGRIADASGEALIGVNVVEGGTTNGTVTDIEGNYMLKLATSNPVLNVSYIGFKTQTIEVGNRSVINIVLEEETSFLDSERLV